MDPGESELRPAFGEQGQRQPDQIARTADDMQPYVVALRLHPRDVRSLDHPSSTPHVDRHDAEVVGCDAGMRPALAPPPERPRQPVGGRWLQQVVAGTY